MGASLEYETQIENDEGEEIDVTIFYQLIPYVPEQGPTYACGGQPAEGGYCEIETVLDAEGVEVTLTKAQIEHWETRLYEEAGDA